MKKLVIIITLSLWISVAYSQKFYTVPYYNWDNHTAFMLSPSPIITGYGPLSEALSKEHNDSTFYEFNGEYYPITSWADYFYWYVNKYWYQFKFPEIYKYCYESKDNYGMASYICGDYFKEYMYPCRIVVTFPRQEVDVNYLSRSCVREYLKMDEKRNSTLAVNDNNQALPLNQERENIKTIRNNNTNSEINGGKTLNAYRNENEVIQPEDKNIQALRASGLGRNESHFRPGNRPTSSSNNYDNFNHDRTFDNSPSRSNNSYSSNSSRTSTSGNTVIQSASSSNSTVTTSNNGNTVNSSTTGSANAGSVTKVE
jgi:hypothetical protein